MPARLLTPGSIWNSFLNSNKRHIIITGGRGTGKTTLLGKLFPYTLRGITTYAVPKQAVYLCENGTENKFTVGVFDANLPGKENKMRPCIEVFSSVGKSLLESLAMCEDEWISIDEIGYLETECHAYCNAINSLMEQKHVAAIVRKQELPFLKSLCRRDDVFLIDLDDPFGNIACVIMASGMGNRFGGNKLMASFKGEPMILRAIEATDGIFAKRVVVTRHTDVAELCRARGIDCILHDLPYRSDTVRFGIEAVEKSESCVFCPGDQPLLKKETVVSLALAAKNNPDNIWRVSFEDTPGAPVLFPKWTFAELATLPQGKGGGFIAKKYPEHLRTVSAQDKFELMDADTPEDLYFLENQEQS
jgi:molybdenum cofactor cytidylyltransferase